jgi:glycogen debranching enzyme
MSYRIDINPDDPTSIDRALKTEWLLTNGLGGYAMGTALGVNTRRYHGLLVAATKPPVGRVVALHSMIEQLVIPREDGTEEIIDLSTQQFVGGDGKPMLHPNGWRHLRRLSVDDSTATTEWDTGRCVVARTLQVAHDENALRIRYEILGLSSTWKLVVRPMFGSRDFHDLNRVLKDADLPEAMKNATFLHLSHNATRWINDSQNWRNFAYVIDRARGQDWFEDWWSPYRWEFDSVHGRIFKLSASLQLLNQTLSALANPSARWRQTTKDLFRVRPHCNLEEAGRQFCVKRRAQDDLHASVIAGYPWFGDWGRDTMISLPGLLLCTGRFDEVRSCLLLFARHMRNGLIPNFFDDSGEGCSYNTVDASLWFVHTVHAYLNRDRKGAAGPRRNASGSLPDGRGSVSDQELRAACGAIIAAYRRGTDFNIFMDNDGLIAAGDQTTQLTWMDAKRDGVVFTPRHGKAVEINALWFNALRCLAEMTADDRERDDLIALSHRVEQSFRAEFWWSERQCLRDVLIPKPGQGDASDAREFIPDSQLRPNQIFAVSLPVSPLNEDQKRAVVKIVGDRFLTPFGLRTLDRDDANYRGRYEGSMFERDRAYHNGTVWPWLIGPYCEAFLRIEEFSDDAKQRVRQILQPLLNELECTRMENGQFMGGCLGQLAEVYDGDPPHRPGGCPAQAWSVAEVLRILTMIDI